MHLSCSPLVPKSTQLIALHDASSDAERDERRGLASSCRPGLPSAYTNQSNYTVGCDSKSWAL